jgi:hypothetical protein
VPFLESRLQPLSLGGPERVSQWIADLDSRRFKERQEASEQLAMQAELIAPALRRALSDRPGPEVRRRLEQVLREWEETTFSSRQLQILRATEVLEGIGTPEAKRLLEVVAGGTPEFRITREAKSSLARLAKRTSAKP